EDFLFDAARGSRRFGSHANQDVLFDRQPSEDIAALRHVCLAGGGTLMRCHDGDVFAVEMDAACPDGHHVQEALQQGGLTDAVTSEQGEAFPLLQRQRYATQCVAAAVVLVDGLYSEHVSAPDRLR